MCICASCQCTPITETNNSAFQCKMFIRITSTVSEWEEVMASTGLEVGVAAASRRRACERRGEWQDIKTLGMSKLEERGNAETHAQALLSLKQGELPLHIKRRHKTNAQRDPSAVEAFIELTAEGIPHCLKVLLQNDPYTQHELLKEFTLYHIQWCSHQSQS